MSAEHMKAILQCVEAGEWPASGDSDDMWLKFHDAFEGGVWSLYHARALDAFNGSLDAAKALHEAVLPGWCFTIERETYNSLYSAWLRGPNPPGVSVMDQTCPAQAWLIAILKALIAKGDADG